MIGISSISSFCSGYIFVSASNIVATPFSLNGTAFDASFTKPSTMPQNHLSSVRMPFISTLVCTLGTGTRSCECKENHQAALQYHGIFGILHASKVSNPDRSCFLPCEGALLASCAGLCNIRLDRSAYFRSQHLCRVLCGQCKCSFYHLLFCIQPMAAFNVFIIYRTAKIGTES